MSIQQELFFINLWKVKINDNEIWACESIKNSLSYVVWALLDIKTIFLSQFTKFHQLEPFYVTRNTGCHVNT